jgi:hypothetical protein
MNIQLSIFTCKRIGLVVPHHKEAAEVVSRFTRIDGKFMDILREEWGAHSQIRKLPHTGKPH